MPAMTIAQEIISNATITGNILRLPAGQLDRKVYQDVAKALDLIGGKWKGGKVMGFVFAADPTDKVAIILRGEKLVSAKKEFQFFQTPDVFGTEIVAEVGILPGMTVLEPEAGQGALVRQILKVQPDLVVDCFELMLENQEILKQTFGASVNLLGPDFMDTNIPSTRKWDRIIANPPFSNNQDIDHVQKMYYLLAPKGVMISVMSPHWTFATDRKCKEFREWIARTGAVVREVEPGTFKESGTNVRTLVVRITKQ
jgi:phospholipid N-methyltransferase